MAEVISRKLHEYPVGTPRAAGEHYEISDERHIVVHTALGNIVRADAAAVQITAPSTAVSKSVRRHQRKVGA